MGTLWTEAERSLPKNYFSALVQLKLLERRLDKDPELKQLYAKTYHDDLDKGYISKIDKRDCFKVDQPREWHLRLFFLFPPHMTNTKEILGNNAKRYHFLQFYVTVSF